eukprot:TRINITY_DN22125_c0_g1_i5.p1 TRINITY_DN22125_c0_g1~~TRINITY_DN22125_c0_g1_i5.p1  ORF type:complete len:753 (-),score=52.53 TRINITY_DN22125_c0_g1_i5:383-2641(-)
MDSCHFINAFSAKDGGAVWILLSRTQGGFIHISNSSFISCEANEDGGALFISVPTDDVTVTPVACVPSDINPGGSFTTWDYLSNIVVHNCQFVDNQANCLHCSGGAVALYNGWNEIHDINFVNNSAGLFGRALYAGKGSAQLIISNVTITAGPRHTTNFVDASLHFDSSGAFSLGQLSISTDVPSDMLFFAPQAGQARIDWETTFFRCAAGSLLTNTSALTSYLVPMRDLIRTLPLCAVNATWSEYSCSPCPPGTYSLARGHTHGDTIVNSVCKSCVTGADCSRGGSAIQANRNFWGFQDGEDVTFLLCPHGYCCPAQSCSPFNECAHGRTGKLCGACSPGYTGLVGVTSCIEAHKCTFASHIAFWGLLCLFAVVAIAWLSRTPLKPPKHAYSVDRVTLFFFQIVPAILVVSPTVLLGPVLNFILELANFRISVNASGDNSATWGACPYNGMDSIGRSVLYAAQPLTLWLGMAIFCLLGQHVYGIPWQRRVPAIMRLLLLTYSAMANSTLSLLTCVPVAGENRLLLQGDINCYQPWQAGVFGFGLVFVLPFGVALATVQTLLRIRIITVPQALAICLLPVPGLAWCLATKRKHTPEFDDLIEPLQQRESTDSVISLLEGPYRTSFGAQYWEAHILFYRLLIAITSAFVPNPVSRGLCQFVVLCLLLVHHLRLQPFERQGDNNLQSISFVALVLLAGLNLRVATLYTDGSPLDNDLFLWAEGSILIVVFACCTLAAVHACKNKRKESSHSVNN